LQGLEGAGPGGFAIIASGLEQRLSREDGSLDKKELQKLFLSLAGVTRHGAGKLSNVT
jgi:hypothetical protein